MQIIDDLEVNKRGPYGGGIGYVAYNGNMDIALALRTMVIPNPTSGGHSKSSNGNNQGANGAGSTRRKWTVHLQVRPHWHLNKPPYGHAAGCVHPANMLACLPSCILKTICYHLAKLSSSVTDLAKCLTVRTANMSWQHCWFSVLQQPVVHASLGKCSH